MCSNTLVTSTTIKIQNSPSSPKVPSRPFAVSSNPQLYSLANSNLLKECKMEFPVLCQTEKQSRGRLLAASPTVTHSASPAASTVASSSAVSSPHFHPRVLPVIPLPWNALLFPLHLVLSYSSLRSQVNFIFSEKPFPTSSHPFTLHCARAKQWFYIGLCII